MAFSFADVTESMPKPISLDRRVSEGSGGVRGGRFGYWAPDQSVVLWDPEHRTSRNCGLDSGFNRSELSFLQPLCVEPVEP